MKLYLVTIINLVVLSGYYLISSNNEVDDQAFLIKTFKAEHLLNESLVADLHLQINAAENASYQRGFEAGKTQTGIAFMQGESMQTYADGYHAAISQWGPVEQYTAAPYTVSSITSQTLTELYYEAVDEGDLEQATSMRELLNDELDREMKKLSEGDDLEIEEDAVEAVITRPSPGIGSNGDSDFPKLIQTSEKD